jgi:hypothetical protein
MEPDRDGDSARKKETIMETARNRVLLVYKTLGQVLNSPQSCGLGDRAPKALVDALSAMRRSLREEIEEGTRLSADDWLSGELSQDAARPKTLKAKSAGGASRYRSDK